MMDGWTDKVISKCQPTVEWGYNNHQLLLSFRYIYIHKHENTTNSLMLMQTINIYNWQVLRFTDMLVIEI